MHLTNNNNNNNNDLQSPSDFCKSYGIYKRTGYSGLQIRNNYRSMSSSSLLFVIVGRNEPLFEAEIHKRGSTHTSDTVSRQNYFVLHSALDLVDKAAWNSSQMYLKVVDKVNQQQVSCFLTAGNIKFLLLHNGRSDDSIRNFFQDVYELYVKFSMNPFYQYDSPIRSIDFETRVQNVARRYNLS